LAWSKLASFHGLFGVHFLKSIENLKDINFMDSSLVSSITDSVDFVTIITGIGAVGAALVILYVADRGVAMLLKLVKPESD
jgi:hypothetical protein